jgi:uncharacterized protein (DUF2267 family)
MVEANRSERGQTGKELLSDVRRRLPANLAPRDAVKAVMCTFSQHVSAVDARHVFSVLPKPLHPLLERCPLHKRVEEQVFDREQLIVRVADHLGVSLEEAEEVTSAVLRSISARLPARQMADVANQLPPDLRELWTERPDVEPHPIFLEIDQSVALPRKVTGARAMGTVMCTLSRGLSLGAARSLFDSLPHEVRPLLDGCLTNRAEEPDLADTSALLALVAKDLHTDEAEPVVRAVFRAVHRFVRPEMIEETKHQLPANLQELWAEP